MNADLADSLTNGSDIAQIAEARRVKAGKDSSFGTDVAKTGQLFGKDLGLLDLIHRSSVSK